MAILSTEIIQLIEDRTGINARTIARADLSAWFNRLDVAVLRDVPLTNARWQRLIHALTIGETYFLRDKQHFQFLRQTALPALVQAQRDADELQLTIWCAGCATGEEPYSIAILLYELLPDFAQWSIRIVGTDINQQALDSARAARYRQWSFRDVPADFTRSYFMQDGETQRLVPFIRDCVHFRHGNILHDVPTTQADIVFCRHVLMYLADSQVAQAEANLRRALKANGWLFLGVSEQLQHDAPYEQGFVAGAPIYRKRSAVDVVTVATVSDTERVSSSPTYQDVVVAVENDDMQRAEVLLQTVLRKDDTRVQAHTLMGYLLANRGDYAGATEHVQAALAVDALCADAHYIAALIHYEQGNTDQAREAINATLYCDRQHVLGLHLLAIVAQDNGKVERSQAAFRRLHGILQGKRDARLLYSDMTVSQLRGIVDVHLQDLG